VGLESEDYEAAYDGVSRCQAILMELINALQPEIQPELCERLSSLYTFLYSRLVIANRDRDPAVVEEVLGLLRYEHQTWSMLLKKLADENAESSRIQATPHAQPTQPGAFAPNGSLIGGTVSLEG
ncbi:MAG: flagellar export chaperone FliS, partial [Phycisphaerales bacterium]